MSRSLRLFFIIVLAAPAWAEAPQQKLQSTLSDLKQSQEQEEKLGDQLESTQTDLKQMRGRATSLAADLQENEERAERSDQDYARLSRELVRTQAEFDQRKGEYAHTLASLLRMKSLPPTAMFSDKESATELMRTSRIMQNTSAALAERAKALRQQSEHLAALKRDVTASKQQAEREQATLGEKQKQLAADLSTRQRLQEKLLRDHHVAEEEVDRLSRQSASLQDLIHKLERSPHTAPKGSATAPSASLLAARGQAQLPVVGRIEHEFGEKKGDNQTYRGLVFSTRPGAAVVAPYAGEVVFTGPFMDYGRMVLLKHGDGFISLLAGLGNISVSLNQQLAKGEPVGSMPAAGPSLYVELRDHSKPIDPSQWFAKLPRR